MQEHIAENINKSATNSCGFNTSGIFKSIAEETMITASFQQFVGSVFKITDSNSNDDGDSRNKLEFDQTYINHY